MRCRENAPGEKKIGYVVAVHRSVGDLKDTLAVPLRATGLRAVDTVGWVEVDGPAAETYGVVEDCLLDDVLLRKHHVAFETAALALTGNHADPLQGKRVGSRELAGVFDVVPDAVGDAPELPLDLFGVVHCVERAAVFEPPEAAAGVGDAELPETGDPGDIVKRE